MKYIKDLSKFQKRALKDNPTFIIRRVWESKSGIFGVMIDLKKDQVFATTLENDEYAIPPGMYQLKKYSSAKYPKTFEVVGVPGRTKILLHKGNIEDHSKGCILIGEQFEGDAILQSGKGFKEFMNRIGKTNQAVLIIERF